MPGVVRTRVGYAGGRKPNPTYHDLGDHAETVEMDFDPQRISYRDLLDVFWQSHNPHRRSYSRQYMSAIFPHGEEQRRLAQETQARIASETHREVETVILPGATFWLAEDYHQKYSLRNAPELYREFRRMYPDIRGLIDSTAAARVNGFLAGYGSVETLEAEIDSYGLSAEGQERLLAAASRLSRWRAAQA